MAEESRHGEYRTYTAGCRCPECLKAAGRYTKRRRFLLESGRWKPWRDPAPVRRHVEGLRRAGLSAETIARLAGVAIPSVYRLLGGDRARVRATFAAKLLAVTADLADLPSNAKVSSAGTRRRVQALVCEGWSITHIAERAGLDRTGLGKAMRRDRVYAPTARAVAEVFDELSRSTPPTRTPEEKVTATRNRRYAAACGWLPATAWRHIDDPDEKPKGVRREAS